MPRYNYPGYGPRGDDWSTKRPGTVGGYHGGSDNPAAAGTPVYSEYTGKIFRSGTIAGYGRSVIVKSVAPDGTTFYALYGHLGPGDLPIPGTDVVAGKPIPGAVIGSQKYVQSMSGLSTGPHLHREIMVSDFIQARSNTEPIRIRLTSIIRRFPTNCQAGRLRSWSQATILVNRCPAPAR
jgi:murein DD-endopeptidase MepM/ murein hydrolase activator NlpD